MERKMKRSTTWLANNMDNGFMARTSSASASSTTQARLHSQRRQRMKVVVGEKHFGSADLRKGKILSNLFYEPNAHEFELHGGHAAPGRAGRPINNVRYSR